MRISSTLSLLFSSAATFTSAFPAQGGDDYGRPDGSAPYKDSSLSVEERVQDLLSRMTIHEKTAQLMQGDMENWVNTTDYVFNRTGLEVNFEQKAGQFYVGHPVPWDVLAGNIKIGQDYAVNETRLGIPALTHDEGIHGFRQNNATIFNSPIAHACSWNRTQLHLMAQQIALETKALGVNQLFAPVADLARELRFGRVEETYGEDPYLAGEFVAEYVRGVQNEGVMATVKHFTAFSQPEQGLNLGPVHGGERELRTIWNIPQKKGIVDAGAWSIMSSYNSYDGVPVISDRSIMTGILREEWDYEYYVISDAGGTDRLAENFGVCPEPLTTFDEPTTEGNECITLEALPAGNDVEMGGGSFNFRTIPELVESGRLGEEAVDKAVSRLLRAKFAMGLFENPYPAAPQSEWDNIINNDYAKGLAREQDRDSIVVLKNDDEMLPLSKDQKVAVLGPMADGFMNYGDYVAYESQYRGITPRVGIEAAVNGGNVTYVQGCERWSNDQSGFPEAIAAAEDADVAVVVVGTWSRDQVELWIPLNATTGESMDNMDLSLVGAMRPLVEAIINTNTPTVVVFQSGKPVTEPWLSNTTASLIQQFYPSQEGGNALADILFGDVNPSGRLSVSYPHDVGALPIYYDYLKSGRPVEPGFEAQDGELHFGNQYTLGTPAAWFPFGYGLSYSGYAYSNVSLSSSNVKPIDHVTASVSVTNNGTRDGAEVVQLYVTDVLASVDVANKQLKGFEKVWIPAGETVVVDLELDVADLGVWNRDMEYVVEPGEFWIQVGASSEDIRGRASLWVQ